MIASSNLLLRPGSVHLLIDPDHWTRPALSAVLKSAFATRVGSLIVGGTYIHSGAFSATMETCAATGLAVGNFLTAGPIDGMLSAASDYVILPIILGSASTRFVTDHILAAAPTIARYGLKVVRVAYLQLDGGRATSAGFFTQCIPIPRGKPEIVHTLSLAAALLGVNAIYLEAGSGAEAVVTRAEIEAAIAGSGLPIIVGGGVSSAAHCTEMFAAGATSLVVGSALERGGDLSWLQKI